MNNKIKWSRKQEIIKIEAGNHELEKQTTHTHTHTKLRFCGKTSILAKSVVNINLYKIEKEQMCKINNDKKL